MPEYSLVIVDDEVKQRAIIRSKLKRYFSDIKVVGEAADPHEGKKVIESTSPDIVCLDIRMPRGDGFDLLGMLEEQNPEVIFITGFDEYALQALKLSAVDYLLKPILDDELVSALEKAKARIDKGYAQTDLGVLKHNLKHEHDQGSIINLPGLDDYDLIQVADIMRFEGEQRYTRVYLRTGKEILSSYNIGVYKHLLENYNFISTHKSHVINTEHVQTVTKEGTVLMKDGAQVPISRRKKEEVKEFLKKIRIQSS